VPLDLQTQTARLFSKTSHIDYLADKTDVLYGRLVYRRVYLFRFILENLRCATSDSQQLLLDITSSFPNKVTIGAIAGFLQVPGIDRGSLNVRRSLSATVQHESRLAKLDIVPLHTVPLLRPSRSSAVAGCKGSTDPPAASQRMSQIASDDGDNGEVNPSQDPVVPSIKFDMEQMRLRAFSTPALSSSWFFLDCYAPTALHAASVLAFLLGARPIPAPEALPFRWDLGAMQEMVSFFWDALHSISARVKHFYADPSLCGHILTRKLKKVVYRVSRALLFQCISYWIVEFLQSYGFNPAALEPFSSIDANVFGESNYERIKTLRLLSLSLRMKSKVPKLFGSRFHAMVSEKVRPVLEELFRLCREMVSLHDSEDPIPDSAAICSTAHRRLSDGLSPLSNPFPSIYEAIVEFLPLAVDRARGDVREISKGYPVSWPDHTPPSIKRKNKGNHSNTEAPYKRVAVANVSRNFPTTSIVMTNSCGLDEATRADRQSSTSSDESTGGRNHPPPGVSSRRTESKQFSPSQIPQPRVINNHVGQIIKEFSHHPPSPASDISNRPGNHSKVESTHSKNAICGDCKDCLYTFFSDGLNKGFTPGAIGLKLWSVLRLREEKKHVLASCSDEASSSDEEGSHSPTSPERSDSDDSDSNSRNDVGPHTPSPRRHSFPHLSDEHSKSQVAEDGEEGSILAAFCGAAAPRQCNDQRAKRRKIRNVSSRNVSFSKNRHDRKSDQIEEEHEFH
jgi:hypothetical protein